MQLLMLSQHLINLRFNMRSYSCLMSPINILLSLCSIHLKFCKLSYEIAHAAP